MAVWTVRIENLADHAVPLGKAINRWLWRWSPWHLRYERDRYQDAALRHARRSEERRIQMESLYKVLQAERMTLHQFFDKPPQYNVSLDVGPDFAHLCRYVVHFDMPRMSWAYMHEPWLRAAVQSDYLVEQLEAYIHDSFKDVSKQAAKQIVDAIKQNERGV